MAAKIKTVNKIDSVIAPGDLAVTLVKIGDVHPHPGNNRVGDVDVIADSLRRHGQYRAIVVNRPTGDILAGNHTWKAAQQLGWTHIAVGFVDVDEDEAKRILLVDNRSADLGSYDDAATVELLTSLDSLDGTGYDQKALDRLLSATEDEPDTRPQLTDLQYRIIIECDGEEHQEKVLAQLKAEGLDARALIS